MNALASLGLPLAITSALLAACGSSSAPSPFNGSWTCSGTTTYTFTAPAKESPITVPTSTTLLIDVNDGSPVTVVSGASDAGKVGNNGAGCSVTYDTAGSAATLAPNQTCPITIPSGNTTYTLDVSYTTGSATVSGGKLTFTQSDTFTGTAVNGNVSVKLAGTVSGSSTCTQ